MELFEGIIKTLLEHEGYWVRQSFKVNVTKEEKRAIGKHSIPRPEIDLLAFKPGNNEVLVIEAKSYFDSSGVRLKELLESFDIPNGRYKLFTCENYRNIVFSRLHQDLLEQGLVNENCRYKLGLVAGNVYQNKSLDIDEYFQANDWFFWSPEMVKDKVNNLASMGYENNTATLTAKILMRGSEKEPGHAAAPGAKSIRQKAKDWLASNTPDLSDLSYRCSKYFEDIDIWFFTIPLTVLEDNEKVVLVLEKKGCDDFYLLKVPSDFLKENLDKIKVRSDGEKFDLHISARQNSWLVDIRGDRLDLSSFLH
ncbi:hypothetical protein ACW0FU_002742 [Vibrio vulnificus]|nr:hypothetical protein [Vibrio vulnificus]MCU8184350.1 hypothetical protein [Vibrio vulnificus]